MSSPSMPRVSRSHATHCLSSCNHWLADAFLSCPTAVVHSPLPKDRPTQPPSSDETCEEPRLFVLYFSDYTVASGVEQESCNKGVFALCHFRNG